MEGFAMPVVCELRYAPVESERGRAEIRAGINAAKQQALAAIARARATEKMQAGAVAVLSPHQVRAAAPAPTENQSQQIPPFAGTGGANSTAPPAHDARGGPGVGRLAHNQNQAGATPAPATLGPNAACAAATTNRRCPGSGSGAPPLAFHNNPSVPVPAAGGVHQGLAPRPQPAPPAAPRTTAGPAVAPDAIPASRTEARAPVGPVIVGPQLACRSRRRDASLEEES